MKIPLWIGTILLVQILPSPGNADLPSQTTPGFQVSLLYTIQPQEITLHYIVTVDSLWLHYNCLYTRCKDTVLYKIRLDPHKAADYYRFVATLQLDSLRNINETKGQDSVTVLCSIRCPNHIPQSLLTVHLNQPMVAALIARTNSLIPDGHFRYNATQ